MYYQLVSNTDKPINARGNFASESVTPEQLILNIASANCRESYKTLFAQFAPKIKSFMMGKGLKPVEAEDIAQDTMLKVWRKASFFDPQKARANTWIFTIANNLRIDALRKLQRQNKYSNEAPSEFYEDDIAGKMIADQSAATIKLAIKNLPADQLQVIRLSFYEDLSHSQIAKSLSLPIGTVKSRLRLALGRLKAIKSTFGDML